MAVKTLGEEREFAVHVGVADYWKKGIEERGFWWPVANEYIGNLYTIYVEEVAPESRTLKPMDNDSDDESHEFFDYKDLDPGEDPASILEDPASILESFSSSGWVMLKRCYAEQKYGERAAKAIDQLRLETFPTGRLKLPWVKEGLLGPHANAKAFYSARLILDADPADVGAALAASLLEGKPKRLDQRSLSNLFPEPPPLAREWTDAFPHDSSFMVMPEHGRKTLVKGMHLLCTGLGMRPLHLTDSIHPIEGMPQGWKGFCVLYRHHTIEEYRDYLGDITKWPAQISTFFAREEQSESREQSESTDRVFTIYSRDLQTAWRMLEAREAHWIKSKVPRDLDGYIVQRCRVRAHPRAAGSCRTELTREILDVTPLFQASSRQLREEDPNLQKRFLFELEEEGRQWSKAWGFDLLEVWRGLRRHQEPAHSYSHICASLRCLCPGEGAYALCEHGVGPTFDRKAARRLGRLLPHENVYNGNVTERDPQLAEGSIEIESFAFTLERICSRASLSADIFRRFVDLGSGCGSAVLAAHILFPFRSCLGIELLPELVAISRQRARQVIDSSDFNIKSDSLLPEDMFVEGDILEADWADASVILCNAVTWPREMIESLFRCALRLRPGSVIILMGLNKKMPPFPEFLEGFDFHTDACNVSWRPWPCAFWLYQRV